MEDTKWESTHVHTQWGRQMGINSCPPDLFYWEYAATKQWAKDGTRFAKPIVAGLT